MPNWVYNSLKVHGTPDKLDKFLEEIKSKTDSDPISFENIVPIDHTKYYTKAWFRDGKKSLAEFPEHIDNELYDDRTYNDAAVSGAPEVYVADSTEVNDRGDHFAGWAYDWYKAQVNEWGTKWDACDPSLTRINQETAELTFNTAWAAPEPVLQALARKYPELNFEYYCTEESDAFYTYGQSEDGEFDLHYVDPRA